MLTAVQALADARLYVTPRTDDPSDGYFIAGAANETATSALEAETSADAGFEGVGDVSGLLYPHDDAWVFEVWECVPEPGERDFVVHFPALETAIEAVRGFYFGQPTIIDDWIVPLHRHPELTLEEVRFAIADAVNVSQEAFDGIAERRWHRVEHRRQLNRWERALQSQFLRLQHRADPTVILRLRRDMQETYIVHLAEDERPGHHAPRL